MDISSLLTEFKHKENIFYSEDNECYIPVKLPNSYTQVPEFEFKLDKHEKCDLSFIKDYFSDILDENYRIQHLNGLQTGLDMFCYYCDYCNTSLLGENDERVKYYYCNDCRIDMCTLCFEEKTEEIAIKNGAKNYIKRQAQLQSP